METLADRIKSRRNQVGLTQEELAKAVGVSQNAIHKLEDGTTKKPRNIIDLAQALKCSPNWLQYGGPENEKESEGIRKIPILSLDEANFLSPSSTKEWLEVAGKWSQQAFAVRFEGVSMTNPNGSPSIPDGAIVIIEPAEQPKSGEIVLAKSTGPAVVKKLTKDGPKTYLASLNPQYQLIEADSSYNIIGVAKKVEYLL